MAIIGFNESSLTTSEIYDKLNQSESNNTAKAVELTKSSKHLTEADIETAYITIKQMTDSFTRTSLKAFDTEKIVLLYNTEKSKALTQALPFMTFKVGGNSKTFVFVDRWVTSKRDGTLNIQPAILRTLLGGALISNALKTNYDAVRNSQYLTGVLTDLYCSFFTRVLNKEYSIMAQKNVIERVEYCIRKFFLINVLGSTESPENIETISIKNLKYIDEMAINEVKSQYDNANPQKISELLELIKEFSPRMKTLALGTFLSKWINYYYPPALLAIDTLEYLLFMIIALMDGTNIVSISAADIVKDAKNIKSFRSELLKVVQ